MPDNNTQTQSQLTALRTLQQSYDTLATASSAGATTVALNTAKEAILTAIDALNNPTVAQIQNGLAKTSELPTGYALETSVKDGNDTTIGLLKDPTNGLVAIKGAIPTVANIQNGLATESNATSNKNAILQAIADNAGVPTLTIPSTTASQELAPNTLYIFSSRSTALTLTLGTPIVGIANEYHLFIVADSTTAPTVTWPSGITWNGGNAPTIAADKTYEISILNNIAAFFEI